LLPWQRKYKNKTKAGGKNAFGLLHKQIFQFAYNAH